MNMDDSDHRRRREKAAKMLLLADDGKLKVSEAMRLAGLSHEDSMNRTAQQQVRRMAEKLKDEKKKPPKRHDSKSPTTCYSVSGRCQEEDNENGNKNETEQHASACKPERKC
jgi:ferric-dicitrate binding protein FerR (iron transport regulator)